MPRLPRSLTLLTMIGLVAALAVGCEAKKKPVATNPDAQPRDTLGKTTQKVLDLKEELAKGAILADMTVDGTPVIGAAGSYKALVGKSAVMKAQADLQLYQALNEKYPANAEEFRTEILKVGQTENFSYPMLPFYQEYAYDAEEHKLVVIEYPNLKAEREKARAENP